MQHGVGGVSHWLPIAFLMCLITSEPPSPGAALQYTLLDDTPNILFYPYRTKHAIASIRISPVQSA